MDKREIFKKVMEDPKVQEAIDGVVKLCGSYGEQSDDVLSYVMGFLSNLYDDIAEAVCNLETIKLSVLLRSMGLSQDFVAKVQREREPFKVKPA